VSKEDIQRRTPMQSEIKDSQTEASSQTVSKEHVLLRNSLESIKKRGRLRVPGSYLLALLCGYSSFLNAHCI
jgi:hypothetical protein